MIMINTPGINMPGDYRKYFEYNGRLIAVHVNGESYTHTFRTWESMPEWARNKVHILIAAYDPDGGTWIPRVGSVNGSLDRRVLHLSLEIPRIVENPK